MDSILKWLQSVDRRWIYLVLAITLVVALVLGKPENPVVLPSVRQLYDEIERAPAGPGQGHIILVGMTFGAGTVGENGNQARALLRHLMVSHKRFAVIAVGEPQGAEFAKKLPADIAEQYGYVYGRDWINFGFQVYSLAFYKGFPKDIPSIVKVDGTLSKPIDSFPIMQGIKGIRDVALQVEVTASASVMDWIQYVQPTVVPRLKIGYCCTGVMAADAYQYLDSGQLAGMMPGMKGAADYEKLVDDREAASLGTRGKRLRTAIGALSVDVGGRPMVPFRKAIEEQGGAVRVGPKSGEMRARFRGTEIQVRVGEKEARVGGKPRRLAAPPALRDGGIYVPREFMLAAMEPKLFDTTAMTSGIVGDPARKLMFTQTAAHLVVILFILLGNIGLLLSRLRAKSSGR